MVQNEVIRSSRLKCKLVNNSENIFFSLVDYKNNLFISDTTEKVVEFYKWFEDRTSLKEWMRQRPNGVNTIHEVQGEKDFIVVIPTADYSGKFAKECRENIFKGLHIVFVESGVLGDFYFNFSHNVNIGIKRAMEYKPKWIIFSTDDVYRVDNLSKLITEISEVDNSEFDMLFAKPGIHHSKWTCFLDLHGSLILKILHGLFPSKFTFWVKVPVEIP